MDGIAAYIHNLLLVRDTCDRYSKRDKEGLRLVNTLGANAPNWTKRDRRRLAWLRGGGDGWQPQSRMDKYHDWLCPRYGESRIAAWYTVALGTAVASNQAPFLEPLLNEARTLAEKMIDEARTGSEGGSWNAWPSDTVRQLNAVLVRLDEKRRAVAMASRPSVSPIPRPGAEQLPAAERNGMPEGYVPLSSVIDRVAGNYSRATRIIKEKGVKTWKPSRQRLYVHAAEWIEATTEKPPSDEACDKFLKGAEERKKSIPRRPTRKPRKMPEK